MCRYAEFISCNIQTIFKLNKLLFFNLQFLYVEYIISKDQGKMLG